MLLRSMLKEKAYFGPVTGLLEWLKNSSCAQCLFVGGDKGTEASHLDGGNRQLHLCNLLAG